MTAKRDVKGLIRALDYGRDPNIRRAAAEVLGRFADDARAVARSGDEHSLFPADQFQIAPTLPEPFQRAPEVSAPSTIGGARAVEPLIAALTDGDDSVRRAAVISLGRIGDERAEPVIAVMALTDNDYGACEAAASALARLSGKRFVQPLVAALEAADLNLSERAAIALGEIGGDRAVDALIEALSGRPARISRRAAAVLGKTGNARAVWPLIAALQDQNVRNAATDALALIGAPAIDPLLSELPGKASGARLAAGVLDKMGWQPGQDETGAVYWIAKGEWKKCGEIGAPAVEPLLAALKQREGGARTSVIGALGQTRDARAIAPLIAALKNGDEYVRREAAEALGRFADVRAVEPLIAALDDKESHVRRAAASALGNIGKPAVEPLIAALNDWRGVVRAAAADALGRIGDARAFDPLIAKLNDGDILVCKAAIDALGKIGDGRALGPLSAKLKDVDSYVRKAAICALEKTSGASAVEPLIAAVTDSDAGVRKEAMDALGRIGDARAVEPLVAALRDSSPGGRSSAAKALDKLAWRPTQDESGAAYWIIKGEWDKCAVIGAPAVAQLVGLLKCGEWSPRKGAAGALVKTYKSGLLDEAHKSLILAQRANYLHSPQRQHDQ
jgi:HEAT repeat protein